MPVAGVAHENSLPMFWRHLSIEQGLSQNTVMSVFQDRQGFIWLATENGLDRFDGYSIQRIGSSRDGTGLSSDFVWTVTEDAQGRMWIATDGGGLAMRDPSTGAIRSFRAANTESGDETSALSSDRIRALLVDGNHLWVGTLGGGLARLRLDTLVWAQPLDKTVGGLNHVYALLKTRDGAVWVGSDSGLLRLDPKTNQTVRYRQGATGSTNVLSDDRVRTLLEDREGQLWVGTFGGGLNRIQLSTGDVDVFRHQEEVVSSLSSDDVRSLLLDADGRIWIGTANGLNLWQPQDKTFIRHLRSEGSSGLSDSYVMSLYQDRGGILWVGTRSAGVNIWNPRSWTFGHHTSSWLSGANVTSFATDQDSLWIGTLGKGVVREFNDAKRPPQYWNRQSQLALPDDRVMSLHRDRKGHLWLGTMSEGLIRIDVESAKTTQFRHDPADPNSLAANGVMSLYEARDGRLWVGTFGGGVSVLNVERSSFQNVLPTALGSGLASAIAEDRDGGVWIGTDAGLSLLATDTGVLARYRANPSDSRSLPTDTIYALHRDPQGTLWIGTAGGGLSRMEGSSRDPKKIAFTTLTLEDGLASDVVYGIQSDARGALWISGNSGLTRHDLQTKAFQTFHRSHGLQGEEFNFGAHHADAEGRLYFGGANGYNAFLPSALSTSINPPNLVLTRFEKLNESAVAPMPHSFLSAVELLPGDHMFAFEFAVLDFTAPEQNRYQYRMLGFDDDWHQANGLRRATYTNLDAGEYRFEVQGANSEGVWSANPISVGVRVLPPWWRSDLAYATYAFILLWMAWQLHRVWQRRQHQDAAYRARLEAEVEQRTLELQARNEELQRVARAKGEFVARMSHELRTPMHGVLGMVDLLQRTPLDSRQGGFVQAIRRSAKGLLEIINDILDFSKLEARQLRVEAIPVDIEQICDDVVESLAPTAQTKGLEISVAAPAGGLPTVLADPLRLNQILVNLLGNAIKFTQQGEIQIVLEVVRDLGNELELKLRVRDTGVGIRAENLQRIFDSFAQEDETTARRFGGTGLGLAITRQLVELMEGTIQVHSVFGKGTEFSVLLCLSKADTLEPRLASDPFGCSAVVIGNAPWQRAGVSDYLQAWGFNVERWHPDALTQTADKRLIVLLTKDLAPEQGRWLTQVSSHNTSLLLLDNLSDMAALDAPFASAARLPRPLSRRQLQAAAVAVLSPAADAQVDSTQTRPTATRNERPGPHILVVEDNQVNQEVALAMLNELGYRATIAEDGESALQLTAKERFDLVLMDCHLPGMDGYRCAAQMLKQRHPMPIIAFTADASDEERTRCLRAGMSDVLSKPCELKGLATLLSRWLPSSLPNLEYHAQPQAHPERVPPVLSKFRNDGKYPLHPDRHP